MTTEEFAEKIYQDCILNLSNNMINDLDTTSNNDSFVELYRNMNIDQKNNFKLFFKMGLINSVSILFNTLDNRNTDFPEDFKLYYGDSDEQLNNLELLDAFQNNAYDWDEKGNMTVK